MKVAIMQPYFLPYLGYWQLINAADIFVLYDNIEFSKRGWFHRNNILINRKRTLFSLPIKNDHDNLEVKYRYLSENRSKYISKILNKIHHSYQKSPHYKTVIPLIEKIFRNKENNLFKFVNYSINEITSLLEIKTKIIISSNIDINHKLSGQEKVINICNKLNADIYINPIGGIQLYNKDCFNDHNIKLYYLKSNLPQYHQFTDCFIPSLSIIDILMFNNINNIQHMLKEYELVKTTPTI